jgi:hypothetical protein
VGGGCSSTPQPIGASSAPLLLLPLLPADTCTAGRVSASHHHRPRSQTHGRGGVQPHCGGGAGGGCTAGVVRLCKVAWYRGPTDG